MINRRGTVFRKYIFTENNLVVYWVNFPLYNYYAYTTFLKKESQN